MSQRRLTDSDDENVDFSLFDEFNYLSYVESDDSKRFSSQRRTYLPLRSSRYDVQNSRYRLSKFPYCDTLVDYTLRRLLPNDERLELELESGYLTTIYKIMGTMLWWMNV